MSETIDWDDLEDTHLSSTERSSLGAIARYQFRLHRSTDLLPADEVNVLRRRSGRVDRVYHGDDRLCTLTTHGRLTLGFVGGRRLHTLTESPSNRVTLDQEAVPFVIEGRNAFAKFVTDVDEHIRPRDEVLVVDPDDRLIAVGRAELAAEGMLAFDRGMAVMIRVGRDELEG